MQKWILTEFQLAKLKLQASPTAKSILLMQNFCLPRILGATSINYYESDDELTPAEKRTLKLKCSIFMYLLPGMSFALVYLDKVAVGSTSIMGIRKDPSHSRQVIQLAPKCVQHWVYGLQHPIGIVTIGKSRTSVERSCSVWLACRLMACSAASQNFGGLLACRTNLDALESVCEPSLTILTYHWAPPDEHYAWIRTWMAWNGAC